MKSVFEYHDYKRYLQAIADDSGPRSGIKSIWAKAAGCNPTYVSQVLNGDREFSLEQAQGIFTSLATTPEETRYLILLVQLSRAGTKSLKNYFKNEIDGLVEQRTQIKNRLRDSEQLSKETQSAYYSAWYIAAIHVAVAIPELNSKTKLAIYFNLPVVKVSRALEFLIKNGLVKEENGHYEMTRNHVHLGHDSENIVKHHANWRTQALESLDRSGPESLHYSAAISLSKADAEKIKEKLIAHLRLLTQDIAASSDEAAYALCFDFFCLQKIAEGR